MVQFYGELSDECLSSISKQKTRNLRPKIIFGSLLVGLVAFVVGLFEFQSLLVAIIVAVALTVLWVVGCIYTSRRTDNRQVSVSKTVFRITIDHDGLSRETGTSTLQLPHSKVKRVVDMGQWYRIVFASKNPDWYCQKDLLVCGTLDQFEDFFRDKLTKE